MAEGNGKANKYKFDQVKQDRDLRIRNGKYYVHLGGKSYVSLKTTNINEARERKKFLKQETFGNGRVLKSSVDGEITVMLENTQNHRRESTFKLWEAICRLYIRPYCRKYSITPQDWNNTQWQHYVTQVRLVRPDIQFENHRKLWSKLAHQMYDRNIIKRVSKFIRVDAPSNKARGFTREQVAKILAVANRELKLQIILAIHSPRRSELLHLRWSEVNLSEGFLEFEDAKTAGRKRYVPLSDQAMELLKGQKTATGSSPFVFPCPRRPNLKPVDDCKTAWRRALRKAGIEFIPYCTRFQDLRGFAITDMLDRHGDVYQVAKVAGNSPQIIKKHYERLEREKLKKFAPKDFDDPSNRDQVDDKS